MIPAPDHLPFASRARGATLLELVVSIAILTVVMGAAASSVLIASKALPKTDAAKAQCTDALQRMSLELTYATAVTSLSKSVLVATIPDRGHGAVGPETIHYSWSGIPGEPLQRQYNSGAVVNVVDAVQDFTIEPFYAVGELADEPRVLLVVANDLSMTSTDAARVAQLQSWQYPVTLIDDGASLAAYAAAVANADVVYVSEQVNAFAVMGKLSNPAIGIVNEEAALYSEWGFGSAFQVSDDEIDHTVITHEITQPNIIGTDKIISNGNEPLTYLIGATGGSVVALASVKNDPSKPMLLTLDVGGKHANANSFAKARRVMLPWGGNILDPFDPAGLNTQGITLLRRSLVWAAAPVVYRGLRITITHASGTHELNLDLLNKPPAPKP